MVRFALDPETARLAAGDEGEAHLLSAVGLAGLDVRRDVVAGDDVRAVARGLDALDGGELYVMNADGSEVRRLTRGGVSYAPAWSPDGPSCALSARVSTA